MAAHRNYISDLPNELVKLIIRDLFPQRADLYDYDINDFNDVASFRRVYPDLSEVVDDEWRNFHGKGQNRIRLCASITDMNFQPLVTFLDDLGPCRSSPIHRLLLTFENFPPLGEASLPKSFWLLILHRFRHPMPEPREHFRGNWDSRWRIGYWAEKFQDAVQLAQRCSQEGISEADFRSRYVKWRARAVVELQRTEQNLRGRARHLLQCAKARCKGRRFSAR